MSLRESRNTLPTDHELAIALNYLEREYSDLQGKGITGEMWAEGLAFGRYEPDSWMKEAVREMRPQFSEETWQEIGRMAYRESDDQGLSDWTMRGGEYPARRSNPIDTRGMGYRHMSLEELDDAIADMVDKYATSSKEGHRQTLNLLRDAREWKLDQVRGVWPGTSAPQVMTRTQAHEWLLSHGFQPVGGSSRYEDSQGRTGRIEPKERSRMGDSWYVSIDGLKQNPYRAVAKTPSGHRELDEIAHNTRGNPASGTTERAQYLYDHHFLAPYGKGWIAIMLWPSGKVSAIEGRDKGSVVSAARSQWGHHNRRDEMEVFSKIFPPGLPSGDWRNVEGPFELAPYGEIFAGDGEDPNEEWLLLFDSKSDSDDPDNSIGKILISSSKSNPYRAVAKTPSGHRELDEIAQTPAEARRMLAGRPGYVVDAATGRAVKPPGVPNPSSGTVYAVVTWNQHGYKLSDAIKVYKTRKAAEREAEKHPDAVVRSFDASTGEPLFRSNPKGYETNPSEIDSEGERVATVADTTAFLRGTLQIEWDEAKKMAARMKKIESSKDAADARSLLYDINAASDSFGVEGLRDGRGRGFSYVNVNYDHRPTVFYDYDEGKFYLTTYDDWIERHDWIKKHGHWRR